MMKILSIDKAGFTVSKIEWLNESQGQRENKDFYSS